MQRVLNFLALFQRERRPGDLVFAVAFFLLAGLALVILPQQAQFFPKKPVVTQPGFWPLIGVLMMVVFGAFHLLGTYNAPRLLGRMKEVMMWARSLEYVVWFILYVTAVPLLGYLPSTLIFALLLSLRLGYRSAQALGSAAAFAIAVVLIFKAGLGVKLPAGEIYQFLPDSIRAFVMVNL